MKLTCDLYLIQNTYGMSCSQITGVYWLCQNLGNYWDSQIINKMEQRLIYLLDFEIEQQKKLEKEYENYDVKEGLQTMNIYDIKMIDNYYKMDGELSHIS